MSIQSSNEISLAILPFQVLTDEREIKHLAFGFTEDLIVNFSKFVGLSVISQHSTSQLSDLTDEDKLAGIDTDYYVTGSFRTFGGKLRIGIQLVHIETNKVIHAGQFDEPLESIVDVLDTITMKVVNGLQQQIDYNLLSYSYKKSNTKFSAYVNYLKGYEELEIGTQESDIKARYYFEEALKIDPNYARAYAGISLSYFNEWSCLLWDSWEINEKGAKEYAIKALRLDENNYQALMILGKTHLFTYNFEKAEHCLRKSIRMNPNDANNLIHVAFCMTYLGYAKEAEKLYLKANQLNPFHKDSYFVYGSFIYFELGDFEKSLELSLKVPANKGWTDFPAYQAATFWHLGDLEKAREYWEKFLKAFEKNIYRGEGEIERRAFKWHQTVNPYKGKTQLEPYWEFLNGEDTLLPQIEMKEVQKEISGSFTRKGELWEVNFLGANVLMKDTKGLNDILKLITDPEKEIHCSELMGSVLDEKDAASTLDQKAKLQYQERIRDLQEEIREAEEMNNQGLVSSLNDEYEKLIEHLSHSLGLAGKARQVGSSVEKARSAVTWRIRSTIKKIEKLHPDLAKHLSKSIKTGTFCSYNPEIQIKWTIS